MHRAVLAKQIVLFTLLFASIGMNAFLVRAYYKQYLRIQAHRLNPLSREAELPLSEGRPVILFGDSRVAGWKSHPDFGLSKVHISGIPGETTAELALRMDRDVIRHNPRLLIVQSGMNDLKNLGVFPGLKEEIQQRAYENIASIVQAANSDGIQVLVLGVIQAGNPSLMRNLIWSDDTRGAIEKLNLRLDELAKKMPRVEFLDCNKVLAKGLELDARYQKDFLHLNEDGYKVLNTLVVSSASVREILLEQAEKK